MFDAFHLRHNVYSLWLRPNMTIDFSLSCYLRTVSNKQTVCTGNFDLNFAQVHFWPLHSHINVEPWFSANDEGQT